MSIARVLWAFVARQTLERTMRYKGGYKITLRKNELKFFLDGADNGLKLDDQEQKLEDQKQNGTKFHSWAG